MFHLYKYKLDQFISEAEVTTFESEEDAEYEFNVIISGGTSFSRIRITNPDNETIAKSYGILPGDKVYYKRPDKVMKGPATIVKEESFYFLLIYNDRLKNAPLRMRKEDCYLTRYPQTEELNNGGGLLDDPRRINIKKNAVKLKEDMGKELNDAIYEKIMETDESDEITSEFIIKSTEQANRDIRNPIRKTNFEVMKFPVIEGITKLKFYTMKKCDTMEEAEIVFNEMASERDMVKICKVTNGIIEETVFKSHTRMNGDLMYVVVYQKDNSEPKVEGPLLVLSCRLRELIPGSKKKYIGKLWFAENKQMVKSALSWDCYVDRNDAVGRVANWIRY